MRKPTGPKLVFALNIALIVLFIVFVLLFTREYFSYLHGDDRRETKPREEPRTERPVKKKELAAYGPILANNVFGFDAGELTPIERTGGASTGAGGLSSAGLILLGTVAWAGGPGYAFIAAQDGRQEVYKVGQDVSGVGALKKVEGDRAFIETSVGLEELKLTDLVEVRTAPAGAPPGGGMARRTSERSYEVDKEVVRGSLDNPKNMMTDARLLPNMVDGAQKGFVVRDVKRGGIYENLGIRNGDVLLRVNDFEISNAETALQAFTALRGLDRVDLDIIRGGEPITLTYTLR